MRRAAATALGGLALTLAALAFDASPLFVPGVSFILLGSLTTAWIWLAARVASVDRDLDAKRVVEDEPLESTVSIGAGAWGLPGAELLDPLVGAPVSVRVPPSMPGSRRGKTVRLAARFSRRGRKRVQAPALAIEDPLGLARVVRAGGSREQEVLVLPRTERVSWLAEGLDRRLDRTGTRTMLEPLAAAEVDGLRPYRDGTPASRIHWPALARGAGLLERRLRADGDSRPLIVLDARCRGRTEDLDAAVRATASLALELGRRTGCGLLIPGRRRPIQIDPDLAAWPAAHAQLAVIEGAADAPAPALAPGAQLGHVFYVAAEPLRRLPPALVSAGDSVAALVLPTSLSGDVQRAASFEVAGCRGFVLDLRARGSSGRPPRRRVA